MSTLHHGGLTHEIPPYFGWLETIPQFDWRHPMPFSLPRAALVQAGIILGTLVVPAGLAAAQEDKVIATVNGENITEADLALAESELGQQFAQMPPEQRRAAALSAMIEIKILADRAESEGLDKKADFQRRMEFLRQRALHSEVIGNDVASKLTDEQVRARYDKEVAGAPPSNEVKARHILVPTKEEAQAVIKQLDEGGNFEAIAKEKSKDAGSGKQGGDLGYFGPGQMVPEFEKAALALNVGSYTKEPVQTQFGWHVIKVEDKRAKQPPAFDQVKDQVRSILLRENYFELVKSLRGTAKVDISDPELKKGVEGIEKAQ
jgi:peptidyl-prolyl cis-trans isomerase C